MFVHSCGKRQPCNYTQAVDNSGENIPQRRMPSTQQGRGHPTKSKERYFQRVIMMNPTMMKAKPTTMLIASTLGIGYAPELM